MAKNNFLIFVFLTIFFLFNFQTISAQSTSFTYQGRLTDNNVQPNRNYQFEFRLFDAASNGTQIGSTVSNITTSVVNGIFTVELDFGAAAFASGQERFLEISVKRDPTDAFTILAPRQRVTAAPYALRAQLAAIAGNATNLGGVAASNYVQTTDGRLTDDRNPAAGSNNYIQNSQVQQNGVNFSISGDGMLGGTLSANTINSATQYNLNNNRIISAAGTDSFFAGFGTGPTNTGGYNAFVGFHAGTANTTGESNSFFGSYAGTRNTTGGYNSIFGMSAGTQNTAGFYNSFFGRSAGVSNTIGSENSFFGRSAGLSNVDGNFNTFIGMNSGVTNVSGSRNTTLGHDANVGSGNLSHATAIGSQAIVSTSNTIALGRSFGEDTVLVPGLLQLNTLGSAGSTQLCQNASNQISTCSSSLRYKTNIVPYSSGLQLIDKLRPIAFSWKADGKVDMGLGAEDVAAVEPLLVVTNKAGQVEGVKYDRVAVVLVNAVKEQQEQIRQQQEQIERQQQMIESLRQLVCQNNNRAAVCSAAPQK